MPNWNRISAYKARIMTSTLALLTLTAGLTACGNSQATDATDTKEISVMGYPGVVEKHYTEAVIEPFMEENPDIKVNYVPGASASEMLGALRGQKGNPTADVAIFDSTVAETANEEGIFQPLDPELVPNMKDVAERGQVEGNYGPAVMFDNLVLLYNTEKFAEAPTSWNALWDEEVAGEIALYSAPTLQAFSLMIITNNMEGANYKETVEPAVERLAELAPSVQTWSPNPDSYTMIANGSASIGIGWNARGQFYSDQSNGKLGVVIPEEGSVFQMNTINLVKGSDSPEAAQMFINYALSPEAQESFTEQMFYAPTNVNAELSDQVASRTATTPERLSEIIDVDWSYVAEHSDEWTDIWRRQIIGG